MAVAQSMNRAEPSLGELFRDLSRDTGALVRHEVALARAEMTQKLTQLARETISLAAGGALAYAGLLALIATIIIGLNVNMGLSLLSAALVTTLVVLGIGGFFIVKGLQNLKRLDIMPRQTLTTIKEDVSWARRQII